MTQPHGGLMTKGAGQLPLFFKKIPERLYSKNMQQRTLFIPLFAIAIAFIALFSSGCGMYMMYNAYQDYASIPSGAMGSDLIEIAAFCGDDGPCIKRLIEHSNAPSLRTSRRKFNHRRGAIRIIGQKDHAEGIKEITYAERFEHPEGHIAQPFAILRVAYGPHEEVIAKMGELNGAEIEDFDAIPITTNWIHE